MSIRSQMTYNAANAFNDIVSSATNLAGTIIDYKGREKQRQDNEDRLFKSNQDILTTQYEKEISSLYSQLPESIQFDQYSQRIESFNADFISNAKNSGSFDDRTLAWLENDFIPSQKTNNERAVAEVTSFATNNWVANNAINKANELAANPSLSVEDATNMYRQYYWKLGLGNIENGPNKYGYLTPEEFSEAIKNPKAVQAFRQLSEDTENGYLYSPTYNKEDTIKEAMQITGYSPDSVQEKQFIADCEDVLKELKTNRTNEVNYAQNAIVAQFSMKYLNGEDYSADDVIQAAREAGAFRADGSVDMMWVSFLNPYIEASVKARQVEAATEQINAELKTIANLTVEDVQDVAGRVSNKTFDFTPSSVKDTEAKVSVSGGKIILPKTTSYGTPVVSKSEDVQGTGLQVSETVSIAPSGTVTVDGQEIENKVFETDNGNLFVVSDEKVEGLEDYLLFSKDEDADQKFTEAQAAIENGADRPVSIGNQSYIYDLSKNNKPSFEDYQPYAGSDKEELSDIAVQAMELSKMTEGTGFENLFTSDGNINYSGSEGKYTYKFEGLPDVEVNHDPLVKALCQEYGIEFDKDSYSVYKLAEYVKELEDVGAFTDANKALVVQTLATARLNPNITPDEYNTMLIEYKVQGALSDNEISSYGLSKHAFSGDLSGTSYNEALKNGYSKLFLGAFGKSYSTSNVNKINEDVEKSDQWYKLQKDFERELTLAYQLDPTGMSSDPLKKVNEIVEKLTDKSFSENLYKALTGSYQTLGSMLTSTTDKVQLGDNANISQALDKYFADGSYAEYLDSSIIEFANNNYHNPNNKDYRPTVSAVKAQIEELSTKKYGKGYSELTLGEKNTVLFSYAYARTRYDFTRAVSDTFGYGMDEIYGNVTVASSDGVGGGFAVVTNDGRVYMSGDAPNGGHNWVIGSVSDRTLQNIKNGATTISFAEISTYGVKTFNDQNMTFTKQGAALTRPKEIWDLLGVDFGAKKRTGDKEIELSDIYSATQPGRYNITNIDKGWRGY